MPKDQERSREDAQQLIPRIEHTKLQEIVSSVDICFDPDDMKSLIEEDVDTLTQYYEFENMVDECSGQDSGEPKINPNGLFVWNGQESMLDKNVTMDDINSRY